MRLQVEKNAEILESRAVEKIALREEKRHSVIYHPYHFIDYMWKLIPQAPTTGAPLKGGTTQDHVYIFVEKTLKHLSQIRQQRTVHQFYKCCWS